jgi:hypothetical protein
LPSQDRSLPVTGELKCRAMALTCYHDSILRQGAHVAQAQAQRCRDVTLATEPSTRSPRPESVAQHWIKQSSSSVYPAHQWIYHVRLRPCRIAGSRGTQSSAITRGPSRGASVQPCATRAASKGRGERRNLRSQQQQVILR